MIEPIDCQTRYYCIHHTDAERKAVMGRCPVCQMAELERVKRQCAEMKEALEGAIVLAGCLAETKLDPKAFLDNNDNVMRIQDAISAAKSKGLTP